MGDIVTLGDPRDVKVGKDITIQYPRVEHRRIETTMMIPNGKTAVYLLGGEGGKTLVLLLTAQAEK